VIEDRAFTERLRELESERRYGQTARAAREDGEARARSERERERSEQALKGAARAIARGDTRKGR
jgi:hypothetical protein